MPAIPVVDAREGGFLRHATQSRARAHALRNACLAPFPSALIPLVPALDQAARRWLTRSCSPYVAEIAQVAALLGFPGVWLLNCSYLWKDRPEAARPYCWSILARQRDGVTGRNIGHWRKRGVQRSA